MGFDMSALKGHDDLQVIKFDEEYFRKYFYSMPSHHPMHEPHYGLVELTKERWDSLRIRPYFREILFRSVDLKRRCWDEVVEMSAELAALISKTPGVFIAGGAVLSCLFASKPGDVDLFFHQSDPLLIDTDEDLKGKIRAVLKINEPYNGHLRLHRSMHAFTATYLGTEGQNNDSKQARHRVILQFIGRYYRTPSEILHGFDLDASGIGLGPDGRIWMTQRCLHAIQTGCNTVDFDRMSPSYVPRLIKYAYKGFRVRNPFSEVTMIVDYKKVEQYHNERFSGTRNSWEIADGLALGEDKLDGIEMLQYFSWKASRGYGEGLAYRLNQKIVDYNHRTMMESLGEDYERTFRYLVKEKGRSEQVLKDALEYETQCRERLIGLTQGFLLDTVKEVVFHGAHLIRDYNEVFEYVWSIPDCIWESVALFKPWAMAKDFQFKRTNPGEQFTSTFHKTILEHPKKWFESRFNTEPYNEEKFLSEMERALNLGGRNPWGDTAEEDTEDDDDYGEGGNDFFDEEIPKIWLDNGSPRRSTGDN
jgi:hypothetical protein